MSEQIGHQPLITSEQVPVNMEIERARAEHIGSGVVAQELDLTWLNTGVEEEPFMPDFNEVFGQLDSQLDDLSDEQSRLTLLKNMDGTQILSFIDTYHALMVPDDAKEAIDRPANVGRNVITKHNTDQSEYVANQLFIEPEDRIDFANYVSTKLTDVETAEQAADTLAFTILNLHSYSDGNGRTARLLHTVIKDGYDGSQEAKQRIQEFSAPRDTVSGNMRPISFNVENTLKEVLLDEMFGDRQQNEDAAKRFADATAFKDKYGTEHTSAAIIGEHLRGIADPEVKSRLIKVFQQSSFGPAIMDRVLYTTEAQIENYPTLDIYARLSIIDDEQAKSLIGADRELRKGYMKRVIDIAAGDKVEYTNKFTGAKEEMGAEGLTMSTEWQARYLTAA